MSYLLISATKGWLDGYYMDKDLAQGAFESLSEQYPNEKWVMTQVMSDTFYIPDNIFHSRARDAEEKAND